MAGSNTTEDITGQKNTLCTILLNAAHTYNNFGLGLSEADLCNSRVTVIREVSPKTAIDIDRMQPR
jgi:hypothetical protein